MELRELINRSLATLPKLAKESDSKQIKADIDMLLGVVLQLTTEMANRNAALARQKQPRRVKPPKSAPQKGPQKKNGAGSETDSADQTGADNRSKALSSIQQGIRQADPSLADEQRALRQQIYGRQNSDVAFAKAAQAIAS